LKRESLINVLAKARQGEAMHLENVDIVHFIPGRVRLRASELRGQQGLAGEIQAKLRQIPGITTVEINILTGSVLIGYESQVLSRPDSLDVLRKVMEELFPSLDLDMVLSWLAKAHH